MIFLDGFSEIAGRYDGFILNLWGVIHDGVTPYSGAVDCLQRLQDVGKKCVLLSNAPRRAAAAQKMLRRMGIEDRLYTGILTSGEVTHRMLSERSSGNPWFAALGQRVFHLGPERDQNVLTGLNLELVGIDEANFVLNTGPDDHRPPENITAFEETLQACARRSLPMICANPDLEVIRGGKRIICAGALAARYQQMGGDVQSFGKPDPAIYQPVLEMLRTTRQATLAVGDSLRTDIAGAAAAGIASCSVLGGIHGDALGTDKARIASEAAEVGLSPVACMPSFVW